MTYEFVSMEDAGTCTGDFIVRLRRKPSALHRRFGAQDETVAYYGQGAKWHAMDGLPASPHVREVLEKLWHQELQAASDAADNAEPVQRATSPRKHTGCDVVQIASECSFPASDSPAWTLGR